MAASYRLKADALRTATHDGELIRVIETTLQSHDRSPVDEIPSDFPFEINKTDGFTDIILTRSLRGEQIEVLVSMPALDQDEEDDSSSSDGALDEDLKKEFREYLELRGVIPARMNLLRGYLTNKVEENSSDFPFEISEKEGLTELTLTRSLKGEQIEVLVSMPKLDQDGKDDEGLLSSSKENQGESGR
ncbi:hypothetical protein ACQ4PT_057336 [Festuca glaucescens]